MFAARATISSLAHPEISDGTTLSTSAHSRADSRTDNTFDRASPCGNLGLPIVAFFFPIALVARVAAITGY